ncbi:MAG: UDP-N-acetylglucosamine 1-carboxyvinyltransferase, partial [Oscillospiraceae bacterium]
MASFIIRGGNRVFGEIDINGAKNSALPILSASILCKKSIVHNCPRLTDVEAACNILTHLGSEIKWEGNTVEIDSSNIICNDIPDKLMREMRSSIVFMGAIVAKCKKAKISYPGGCELGPRPIDIHIAVMKKLGVSIDENHGFLDCVVNDEIEGTNITLPFPSVGATENAMITAVTAKGETVIYNAAREPEILDLANFLNACGGKIKIEKTGTIVV